MREHTDIISEPDDNRISDVLHSNGSLQSIDSDRHNDVINSAEMADTFRCDIHSSDSSLDNRVPCTANTSVECKTTDFDHCKGFSLSVGQNSHHFRNDEDQEKLLLKSTDDSELCEDNDVDICDEGSSDGVNDDEVLGLLTCEGKTFHDVPETVTPNAESRFDSNEKSVKCCNDGLVCSHIVGFSRKDSVEEMHSGTEGLDEHGNKETSASDRSGNVLMNEKPEYGYKVNNTELDQAHSMNTDALTENSLPCNGVVSDLTASNALLDCDDKDNIPMYCSNHDDTEGQKEGSGDCREIDDHERDDASSTNGDDMYDDNDVEKGDDNDDENDGLPIDRGWAWMITLGTFILFLLIPGYNNVLAVLFLDIVQYYETSVTAVTIMQSACCLAYSILCQLTVHMLLKRFSVRLVTTVAALVNASATLLVLTSNNMAVFAVLQVVKFSAHGAILTPSLALVGMYFKRRRALASSIALLGLSFASVLAPLMIRYLRQQYGFKGCFLVMSGYELHGIVATSLLRPLSYYRKRNNKHNDRNQTSLPCEDSKSNSDATTSNYKQSKKNKCCLIGIAESGQSTDCSCSDENVGLLAQDCVRDECGNDHQGKTMLQNGSLEIVPNLNYNINGVNGLSSNSNICIEISDTNHTDGQCSNNGNGRAVDLFLYKLLHPLQRENASSTITISEVCEHKSRELCYCPTNRTMVLTPNSKDIDNTNWFSGQRHFTGSCDFIHNARHRNNGLPLHDTLSTMSSRYHSVNSISKRSYVSARMSTLELTPSMMCSTLNVDEVSMTTHDPQHKSDTPKTNQNLCMEVFRSVFNFSAFKNWSCVALIMSYILARAGTLIIIYLPSYATQSGLPQQEAAILVTVFGAVDMFSRVGFGFLGDLHLIRPKYIIATTATIIGILSCFVGFFQSFQTLVFFSATLGLIGVVTLSLNTTNIIDIAGLDMLGPLLALGSLLLTLSNTFQFPILGLLIETTGSFLPVFYYAAVSYLLAVVLLVTEAPIQRLWKRHTDVSLPQ